MKRLLLGSSAYRSHCNRWRFSHSRSPGRGSNPEEFRLRNERTGPKVLPIRPSGQNIDINVTGDVGGPYAEVRQHTIDVTSNLRSALERASSYRGYADRAPHQLSLTRSSTPSNTRPPFLSSPGHQTLPTTQRRSPTTEYAIAYRQHAVSEVWIWAYQGPGPQLAISESKMSGPFGDISNSYRQDDMPHCGSTYRVYTFNYGRAPPRYGKLGHQFEAELDAIDSSFFRNIFQGPNYPQTLGVTGRCGSVHNPPNARSEYDRDNHTPDVRLPELAARWTRLVEFHQLSKPGDAPITPTTITRTLTTMIWNWQNFPGKDNSKVLSGLAFAELLGRSW